ncbi:MAG TPA: MFS transporter [Thermoanaerobaculia bacterium]
MDRHDPYAALRYRNFVWLLVSYAMSTVAREAQIVVVGWQVFALTRDPLSLGLIGLAEALPLIAMALYAGHVADRVSRRAVAIAGTFAVLVSAVALYLFTVTDFIARGRVWPVYAVIFLSGIARSFTRPALTALSAELVPRELYTNAVTWRSSAWQAAAVGGPALGGLLYGFSGPALAYAVVSVLTAISLVGIALIEGARRAPLPVGADSVRPSSNVIESVKVGIRFLFKQPVLLPAMTLDLFSVLFGGATALLPIFAERMHAGPQGLGLLRAAPAAGSIVVGLIVAHRPPMRRAGPTLFACVGIFGLCMIAFALSRNFWLSLSLLGLSGAADQVSVIIRGTLITTLTPRELLGRVSAVNQIFIGSSNEIGAFESGVAARIIGVVPSVVFGGVMTLIVVTAVAAWSRPLREMREL